MYESSEVHEIGLTVTKQEHELEYSCMPCPVPIPRLSVGERTILTVDSDRPAAGPSQVELASTRTSLYWCYIPAPSISG
jgi:hypothetical protein